MSNYTSRVGRTSGCPFDQWRYGDTRFCDGMDSFDVCGNRDGTELYHLKRHRISSFKLACPVHNPYYTALQAKAKEFAQAGFYLYLPPDRIQCYRCKHTMKAPFNVSITRCPSCTFADINDK
jgi:hypothetical protein